MSNKQRIFYKVMHIISVIAIVLNIIGVLFLFLSWFMNAAGKAASYEIEAGVLSFAIPENLVEDGFAVTPLFFITSITLSGAILVLLFNTMKIFSNLKKQAIFIPKNASYIRNIGWIVIILSVIKNIPEFIQIWGLRTQMDSIMNVSFSVVYELDFGLLFSGLSILAIALIFKQAVKIAEENQLTI